MGPRNNREDRASDATVVFPLPATARYLDYLFLDSNGPAWGWLYLTKVPADIYTFVAYRHQLVRNNFQSMYERALFTSKYMLPAELDSPL